MNLFLFVWRTDKNLRKIAMSLSLSAVEGGEGERERKRERLCFFSLEQKNYFLNMATINNGNVCRFTLEDVGVVVAGRSVYPFSSTRS